MTRGDPIPVACTLTGGEQVDRAAEFAALFAGGLVDARRTEDELLLRFGRGEEDAVRDLLAREQECCPFLTMSITADDDSVTARIGAPTDGQPVLDAFAALAARSIHR